MNAIYLLAVIVTWVIWKVARTAKNQGGNEETRMEKLLEDEDIRADGQWQMLTTHTEKKRVKCSYEI